MWEDFSGTVGFWADMDNPYVTYDNNFIESEWWALKEIWNKNLLYKGFKIVPYCPRCGTPLSSHEVAQGYKAVGFWMEHLTNYLTALPLSSYAVNISELEKLTGIDFFCNLPDDIENRVETLPIENVCRAWGI